MTGQSPLNPADGWEEAVNDLLDGALDEASTEALKAAAAKDGELVSAIVRAWQLQKKMDELGLERAPPSLRRKLRRIPREHRIASRYRWPGLSRWVLAGGMTAVVMALVALTLGRPGGPQPRATASSIGVDAARVEQTRRDLATAFYYLDKVGLRVGREIHQELNDELSDPIRDNLSKHLPYTGQTQKEKQV